MAEDITATEGGRLKAFIESRWTRADGGMTALADKAHLRRPTLYAWFRGADAPNLASLRALATALGVRRVDLLAAIDGVIAPEQQETPRPDWAEGLAIEAAEKALTRLTSPEFRDALVELVARIEATPPPDDGSAPEEASPPGQDAAGPAAPAGG